MRVVLDSNVILSGFLWTGTSTQLITLIGEGTIQAFASQVLLDEISDVLQRSKHAKSIASTGFTAKQLINSYKQLVTMVPTPQFTKKICRDADDDMVLACALAAKVNMIVSGDKDLLILHPWREILILNPANAIEHILHHCAS